MRWEVYNKKRIMQNSMRLGIWDENLCADEEKDGHAGKSYKMEKQNNHGI